jgi:hypothetical protein
MSDAAPLSAAERAERAAADAERSALSALRSADSALLYLVIGAVCVYIAMRMKKELMP